MKKASEEKFGRQPHVLNKGTFSQTGVNVMKKNSANFGTLTPGRIGTLGRQLENPSYYFNFTV
jgi:hypothetical protein